VREERRDRLRVARLAQGPRRRDAHVFLLVREEAHERLPRLGRRHVHQRGGGATDDRRVGVGQQRGDAVPRLVFLQPREGQERLAPHRGRGVGEVRFDGRQGPGRTRDAQGLQRRRAKLRGRVRGEREGVAEDRVAQDARQGHQRPPAGPRMALPGQDRLERRDGPRLLRPGERGHAAGLEDPVGRGQLAEGVFDRDDVGGRRTRFLARGERRAGGEQEECTGTPEPRCAAGLLTRRVSALPGPWRRVVAPWVRVHVWRVAPEAGWHAHGVVPWA